MKKAVRLTVSYDDIGGYMKISELKNGETATLVECNGSDEVRTFLAGLGFVYGVRIKVVKHVNSDMIIKVCNSRIAISGKIADQLTVV